ncbi:MAG: IS1595 family transposase [Candidatus Chryseobacterium colombiense]|nr:IS1595 family transposase [Chryseobacterium sp.]WEK71014.1 MAG: IS1595 family transposase [Chryseobacterium sp.]
MNNSPKGILSLIQKFPTEEKCIEYLESIRWNGHIDCPHCGSTEKIYKFKDNRTYKCANCKRNFSVTKNTIFERSHIPLKKWFVAIYLFASHKKGISSHQLARDLDITQPNAWFLLHRIRFAMNNNPDFKRVMNGIIEIDETYVGGKNKNRHWSKRIPNSQGRSLADKSAIFGILSRESGVITFHAKQLPKKGLQAIIKAKVAENAIVNTDEYRAYLGLNKFFTHKVVNHGAYQYANGDIHTTV